MKEWKTVTFADVRVGNVIENPDTGDVCQVKSMKNTRAGIEFDTDNGRVVGPGAARIGVYR